MAIASFVQMFIGALKETLIKYIATNVYPSNVKITQITAPVANVTSLFTVRTRKNTCFLAINLDLE